MARTQRRLSTLALGLALGAVYCSSGGGKGPRADDPRGVTERVRTLVARFTYDASGPYATSNGGGVFAPSQGGPFEGADSSGVIGPPSLNGGVYDRTDFCSSACQQVATCFGVGVPADCASDCNAQVQEVGRRFGNGCLGPLVDFYSCIFDSLICTGAPVDGDNEGDEGPLVVAPD
ncbi:MAG TPA: hypothetical protein VFS00_26820, partial [Polyangiaceae bacterium]|nr:hypothetical protein [Polyangiaceae bacterium]